MVKEIRITSAISWKGSNESIFAKAWISSLVPMLCV
jgi:hypothetical protein